MNQRVKCEFELKSWSNRGSYSFAWFDRGLSYRLYTCTVKNQTILADAELEFIGTYFDETNNRSKHMSNVDVVAIKFQNCTVTKIPQGLTIIFPKLEILEITKSKLKYVKREDFKDLTELTRLHLNDNEIEYLPSDLFADLEHLCIIRLNNNKIKMIESGLLDGLKNLEILDLSKNPGIDKYFDSFESTGTIDKIKQEIRDKYWKKISKHRGGIIDDLKCVIQNEKLKDFTVKVEGEEFKVHKMVLAARSSVLLEMIENNIDAVSLNLDDISAETFRQILNFIYTDELPTSDNINFVNLFTAADKLKIWKLHDLCSKILIKRINAENAFDMLTLANKYEHNELRQKSFEKIKTIHWGKLTKSMTAMEPDLLEEALKNKMESDN